MEGKKIKRIHFETLKPLCPVCKQNSGQISHLEIRSKIKQSQENIIEGILICPNHQCLREYPIIDGIPIIVYDLRTYVSQNIISILGRNDFSDPMESLIGDCCGPESIVNSQRQYLSTYTFDHYGDLDPEESGNASAAPGSVIDLIHKGLTLIDKPNNGHIIDIGCAVGRTSFELAKAMDGLVLGIDLNFTMVKTAAMILEKGEVNYPRRRMGIVYNRRAFAVAFENTENIDFWVCDATSLPFESDGFSFAVSINVLDCVNSPYDHIKEVSRILKTNSRVIFTSPYDWSMNATPVESWLGGHSQRSENLGNSEVILKSLLADGGHPNAIQDLILESDIGDIPWTLRLHDRSIMEYLVHLIVARKISSSKNTQN